MTKKKHWHLDDVHQKSFNDLKATISKEVVQTYPDYSKEFKMNTDASLPGPFFSRELSETQQSYSMTKLEQLAIVEALNEFKGMLWGQRNMVYTDHQNLIQGAVGLTSDGVYQW